MNNQTVNPQTKAQLISFIERIEKIDEEIKEVRDTRKDVLAEASDSGFDKKIINRIVKMRKKSKAEREEEEQLLETYLAAIGEI